MALQQSFNNQSGTSYGAAANEEVYDPNILNNLGDRALVGSEVDYLSLQLGDTGSEAHLAVVGEMASVSSGEFGKARTLERDVDQSTQARTGSRSFNLSEGRQDRHDQKWAQGEALVLDTPDQQMPEIGNSEPELEVAIQASFEKLLEAGVPEGDLVHAMAAGGTDGLEAQRATVEAFHDLAQDRTLPLTDYLQNMDHSLASLQKDQGIQNVVPPIGVVVEAPEVAVNDFEFEQPAPAALGMRA